MPRPHRDTAPGIFHVTCHSVWTNDLFLDDVDRMEFLRELAAAVSDFSWTCVSYCLMRNHVHLILEVGQGSLPTGMRQLSTRYACRFNKRHELRGHVFAGRYDSNRIHTDAQLKVTFAYDANNPVKVGASASAADWIWSSYRGTIGLDDLATFVDPTRILRLFGESRDVAIRRLRAFVEGVPPWRS